MGEVSRSGGRVRLVGRRVGGKERLVGRGVSQRGLGNWGRGRFGWTGRPGDGRGTSDGGGQGEE